MVRAVLGPSYCRLPMATDQAEASNYDITFNAVHSTPSDYSPLMFAALTIGHHFSISDW